MFAQKKILTRLLLVVVVVFMLLSGINSQLFAQEQESKSPEYLFEMSIEELMEVPIVIASSKREQPLTEAASSVRVVTSEDIKLSGATNLGDVLRSVAGIDVREAHAGQHVIGIRGFCDTAHVLVTIDGNNVFMYHANHIFLDWAPIDLEEIDRIEIIKGPGAVFYGGSAFSGVINIITKTPRQLEGTQINMVGGNWHTMRGNIIHAGSYRDMDYSLSAGYRQAEEWEKPDRDEEREKYFVKHFAGKAVYHIDEVSSFSLSSRYSDADNVISRVCNPETTFISLRYDRPDFLIRLFYNNHEKTFWDDTFGVTDSNYELELLRTVRWGKNITSFGGYAKRTSWEVETLKYVSEDITAGNQEEHTVKDYALNLENEYHVNDRLILTLGVRGEHYTHLDYLGLGRGSIIYKPAEDQTIRFTIASGYFIPSLFQHTNEGTAYPYALGNSSLEEEKITSYELSYYNRLNSRLKLNMSLFYNEYRDLIDNTQSGPMENIADAHQYGGELELDFILADWLTGFANYAYQTIDRDDFGKLEVDPEHKVNCGLRAKYAKWSANVIFHYVDSYYEMYLTSNPVFGRTSDPVKVDSYTTVDARIAYNINNDLEVALAASNLFNDRHYESNPPDDPANYHTGDPVGRRITAGVSYKF
jgi:iron complex outermembrane receptor protein